MSGLDYDLWTNLWTKESYSYMQEHYTKRGITKEKLTNTWGRMAPKDKHYFLVDKIEFSNDKHYAIMRYSSDEKVAAYGKEAMTPKFFVKNGNEWLLIQRKLIDHPISKYMFKILSSTDETITIE